MVDGPSGEIQQTVVTQSADKGITLNSKLSRRNFIRTAAYGTFAVAAAAAGCVAPPPVPQPRPEVTSAPDVADTEPIVEMPRFFEDIDSFNPDETLPILREKLTSFAALCSPAIEKHLGTDPEELQASFDNSISVLRRMYEGYRFLNQSHDPILKNHTTAVQDDFYEMGSALYAIDLVYELFKNNPEQFEDRIQRYAAAEYSSTVGYSDMLIGDQIFTMNAAWTDLVPGYFSQNSQPEHRYFSPVVELLAPRRTGSMEVYSDHENDKKPTPGLARLLNKEPSIEYPRKIGVENLPDVRLEFVSDEVRQQEGVTTDMRQKKGEVAGYKSEQAKRYVEKLLRKYGLERITPIIELLNLPYGGIFMTSGSLRLLQLQERLFEDDNYKKYPLVAEKVTLHELGHAFKFALSYLPTEEYQQMKARIDAGLEDFRPYTTNAKLFSPPDEIPAAVSFGAELAEMNEMARVINWSTVTNYGAKEYFQTNWSIALNEHESSGLTHETKELLDVFAIGMPDNWLIRELNPQDQEQSYSSFSQFYQKIVQNSLQSPLGRFIHDEIQKNADIFTTSVTKLDFGYARLNGTNASGAEWLEHLQTEVIPATIAYLVNEKPEEFLTKTKESTVLNSNLDERKIEHAIGLYRKKVTLVKQFADHELLADVFADTLRRKNPDITMSEIIPSPQWEQIERSIADLLQRLKTHGLAHDTQTPQIT